MLECDRPGGSNFKNLQGFKELSFELNAKSWVLSEFFSGRKNSGGLSGNKLQKSQEMP